jgi:hypothetical protein
MKCILKDISLVILSTLVVFLSMGVSISKMQCSKDGEIFIGTEVPNCMQKQEIACSMAVEKISCCSQKEIEISCCPQTPDNSCASETTSIQFNFETLITLFDVDFKDLSSLLYTFILYDKESYFSNQIDYISSIPLYALNKPQLEEIQLFLL